jgi:orotidine-5'-phosphate decarboxylase
MARIFCAIDTADTARALALARQLSATGLDFKLGLEFFTAQGPDGVRRFADAAQGRRIFLDLKLHDIPNTVAAAVRAAAALPVDLLTLHASGGAAMLRTAQDENVKVSAELNRAPLQLLAVSVLTHMDQGDMNGAGVAGAVSDQVLRLADLAAAAGIAGLVCAPTDLGAVKARLGDRLYLVTPGIRPAIVAGDDQKRVMTPRDALRFGADALVIGRPVTGAADPAVAARTIISEIGGD